MRYTLLGCPCDTEDDAVAIFVSLARDNPKFALVVIKAYVEFTKCWGV